MWETNEHHDAFVANKEEFGKLMHEFEAVASSIEYVNDVTLNAEPYTALNAPTTEFALWTLKDVADRAVFQQKLSTLVNLLLGRDGVYKGGWGPVAGNEKLFYVVLGWESLEVRLLLCMC